MGLFASIPLLLAIGLLLVVLLTPISKRIDLAFGQIALELFRNFTENHGRNQRTRRSLLHAIHSTTTYSIYASKTLLYSVVIGIAGSLVAGYTAFHGLQFLMQNKQWYKETVPEQLHFIVAPRPLNGVPSSSSSSGGITLSAELFEPLLAVIPNWIITPLAWLLSLVPESIRETVPGTIILGNPEGASASDGIAIVIQLPNLDFIPDTIQALSGPQALSILAFVGGIGLTTALSIYSLRWYWIKNQAQNRAALIDMSMLPTISFIYAISQSGMAYPSVVRTVAQNRAVFGETGEEFAVLVKWIDSFGMNLITGLRHLARQTPSDQLTEFLEGFAGVLQSGENIETYLSNQYEQFQREQETHQEQVLEILAALGEGYVAILVAGPLFLITLLTIFGLLTGGLLIIIQLIIYLWIPFANIGFLFYLTATTKSLRTFRADIHRETETRPISIRRASDPTARSRPLPDGGETAAQADQTLRRLEIYARLRTLLASLKNPARTVIRTPTSILVLTIPLAIVSLGVRWSLHRPAPLSPRVVDDWVIQAILFVVGTYAVGHELHSQRLKKIESSVPDLLEELASTNAAGMTFTESLKRMDLTSFNVLQPELERILSDINWGARTERALFRFSERIRSGTIARIVALITNAMQTSGSIGPIIRIAADQARKDRQLKQKRWQEMVMYIIVIYISFAVFLGITLALNLVLVPAVPNAGDLAPAAASGTIGSGMPVSPVAEGVKAQYMLLLFHAAAVQAIVSGFVAGQMGTGRIGSGAKHVTIMLTLAYVLFLAIG